MTDISRRGLLIGTAAVAAAVALPLATHVGGVNQKVIKAAAGWHHIEIETGPIYPGGVSRVASAWVKCDDPSIDPRSLLQFVDNAPYGKMLRLGNDELPANVSVYIDGLEVRETWKKSRDVKFSSAVQR